MMLAAKVATGYNYLYGAFTYGRGLVRGVDHLGALVGLQGKDENFDAILADDAITRTVDRLLACASRPGCRENMLKVARILHDRLPPEKRTEFIQIAIGRLATGIGISYAASRLGVAPAGPTAAGTAVIGDLAHHGATIRSYEDLISIIATGKRH